MWTVENANKTNSTLTAKNTFRQFRAHGFIWQFISFSFFRCIMIRVKHLLMTRFCCAVIKWSCDDKGFFVFCYWNIYLVVFRNYLLFYKCLTAMAVVSKTGISLESFLKINICNDQLIMMNSGTNRGTKPLQMSCKSVNSRAIIPSVRDLMGYCIFWFHGGLNRRNSTKIP